MAKLRPPVSVTVAGCWGKAHGKKQQLAIQDVFPSGVMSGLGKALLVAS